MRDLCVSGQLVCYVADLGDAARGPAAGAGGPAAPAGAGRPAYLYEGFFLQTVSKGV